MGLIGLQIAKAMGAGLVIGSSTNPERRARLDGFGRPGHRLPRSGLGRPSAGGHGREGIDAVVDQLSGYVANDNMRATRIGGRVVNVGRLGGEMGDFHFDLHALRRIEYIGVTFRTRSTKRWPTS